jgi:hypothetical protein
LRWLAGEHEQLPHQRLGGLASVPDLVEVTHDRRRFGQVHPSQLHVAQDRRQQVVEIVRDARREATQRLDPLRLRQLPLELPSLLVGAPKLAHVATFGHQDRHLPVLIEHWLERKIDVACGARAVAVRRREAHQLAARRPLDGVFERSAIVCRIRPPGCVPKLLTDYVDRLGADHVERCSVGVHHAAIQLQDTHQLKGLIEHVAQLFAAGVDAALCLLTLGHLSLELGVGSFEVGGASRHPAFERLILLLQQLGCLARERDVLEGQDAAERLPRGSGQSGTASLDDQLGRELDVDGLPGRTGERRHGPRHRRRKRLPDHVFCVFEQAIERRIRVYHPSGVVHHQHPLRRGRDHRPIGDGVQVEQTATQQGVGDDDRADRERVRGRVTLAEHGHAREKQHDGHHR